MPAVSPSDLTNRAPSGYQRQLRFRRRDGSFSSYGQEDKEGSLWLTAFVVRTFREAAKYIDTGQWALGNGLVTGLVTGRC